MNTKRCADGEHVWNTNPGELLDEDSPSWKCEKCGVLGEDCPECFGDLDDGEYCTRCGDDAIIVVEGGVEL